MHHHHLLPALIPLSWCWLSEKKQNDTEQFQHGHSSPNILNLKENKQTEKKNKGRAGEKKESLLSVPQLFACEHALINKIRSQNHRMV